MSVSIVQGPGLDMDAILQGGDQFMARLKQFQESKQAAEHALNDLNLGNGAAAAKDEAYRQLELAKQEAANIRNAAMADASRVRDSVKRMEGRDRKRRESRKSAGGKPCRSGEAKA
jgi:hypothetical protein